MFWSPLFPKAQKKRITFIESSRKPQHLPWKLKMHWNWNAKSFERSAIKTFQVNFMSLKFPRPLEPLVPPLMTPFHSSLPHTETKQFQRSLLWKHWGIVGLCRSNLVKNLEIKRYPGLSRWAASPHLQEKDRGRFETQKKRGGGKLATEAEVGGLWPQANECW